MNETNMDLLRQEFGRNKDIPKKYEQEILMALSHYPELRNTHIDFILAVHALVPYGTRPSVASCFKPRSKRVYTITILEYADYPERDALMKNLSSSMRLGVFGHELAHVVQYERCNPIALFKTLAQFAFSRFRKRLERGADKAAITHGLGRQLLEHARYIRTIPGYIAQRPNLDRDYLLPYEIEFYLNHPDKISAA